jgi:hypothetical protein
MASMAFRLTHQNSVKIGTIGVGVVVQEQLHHLGRPRSVHGADFATAMPVEVLDLGAFF